MKPNIAAKGSEFKSYARETSENQVPGQPQGNGARIFQKRIVTQQSYKNHLRILSFVLFLEHDGGCSSNQGNGLLLLLLSLC